MKIYLITYKDSTNRTCLIAESKAQAKELLGKHKEKIKSINEIATDRPSVPRILVSDLSNYVMRITCS